MTDDEKNFYCTLAPVNWGHDTLPFSKSDSWIIRETFECLRVLGNWPSLLRESLMTKVIHKQEEQAAMIFLLTRASTLFHSFQKAFRQLFSWVLGKWRRALSRRRFISLKLDISLLDSDRTQSASGCRLLVSHFESSVPFSPLADKMHEKRETEGFSIDFVWRTEKKISRKESRKQLFFFGWPKKPS